MGIICLHSVPVLHKICLDFKLLRAKRKFCSCSSYDFRPRPYLEPLMYLLILIITVLHRYDLSLFEEVGWAWVCHSCDRFVLTHKKAASEAIDCTYKNASISCVRWHWVCCIHIFKLKNADCLQTTVTELFSNKNCAIWGNKCVHT